MERVLITICGRAGSKGFANKNLKQFNGHPLSHYSLAAAELFAKARPDLDVTIALNTDSPELERVVLATYPEVQRVERPAALAGDTVPKMAVFQHTLAEMERRTGRAYNFLIDLDITSPLRQQGDVAGQFAVMEQRSDLDIVFSVTGARRNPWFNQFKINAQGYVERVILSHYHARQEAPVIYDVNASIYVFRRDFLAANKTGSFWEGHCGMYEMFDTAVLDIDSEEDYLLMEVIARHLYETYPAFRAVQRAIRP